jgi:predicted metal-dependent HD superfamily phosphohydrolase
VPHGAAITRVTQNRTSCCHPGQSWAIAPCRKIIKPIAKGTLKLLSQRYRHAALFDLFRHVPLAPSILRAVRRRMSTPSRHYHNLDHVAEMWLRHRKMARGTLRTPRARRLIASAIAFHDAVYDPRRSDNEAASAALWRRLASQSRRLPRELIRQVATAIEATACHSDTTVGATCDPWVRWVLDLDLIPIAASGNRFTANASRLRSEQSHLSAAAWEARSNQFYSALQRRDHIFHCQSLIAAFEANARRHLRRAQHNRGW